MFNPGGIKYKILIFSLISNLAFGGGLFASNSHKMLNDTILLKKGTVIVLDGNLISPGQDTLMVLPDSVIKSHASLKTASDFYKIQKRAEKNRLINEIASLIFIPITIRYQHYDDINTKRADFFSEFQGKIIRNITIKKLEVFGTNIQDTSYLDANRIERSLNKIHINTRDWVIRKNILFSVGDQLDPFLFAENERYLRDMNFLRDARFIIIEDTLNPDIVDVIVVVKDVFQWAANVQMNSIDETVFSGWNANMLGIGHRLDLGITYQTSVSPALSFRQGKYSVKNIAGTFIDGNAFYQFTNTMENSGIALSRNLIPRKTRFLYGLSVYRQNQDETLHLSDTTLTKRPGLLSVTGDFGRSFPLTNEKTTRENPAYLILQANFKHNKITSLPEEISGIYTGYYNYNRYLGSVAFSKTNLMAGSLFKGFGKTEDIPYGYKLSAIGGWETGYLGQRYYAGINCMTISFFKNKSFLSTTLETGGFFKNSSINQGIFNASAMLVSSLHQLGLYYHRHLVSARYVKGFNRFDNEFLFFDYNSGFPSFDGDELKGHERLTFTLGSQLYTPWYLLGFRINVVSFFELGLLPDNNQQLFGSAVYPAIGGGFKIKNENLIFDVFQLNFIWYPNTVNQTQHFYFFTGAFSNFPIPNLYNNSIEIGGFR